MIPPILLDSQNSRNLSRESLADNMEIRSFKELIA